MTRFSFKGKQVLATLIDIPFSISPVIVGLAYLMTFGRLGWFYPFIRWFNEIFGTNVRITFAIPGVVLATIFVTFPYVSREIIPVLNAEGKDEEEAAALMGASGFTIFRKITLPQMKWSLIYGIILCTARALGEFGAVNALSKTRGETFTLPLEIDALFRYMTIYDNVAFGLELQKMPKKLIKERVTKLLEMTGLSGLEKRYPNQLSGGQRQRVAFARALAPNPQVLLLDEPFAAIDAKVRGELRTWLKELVEKLGITSIFVTHDQDEAVEVADEIIITNHGTIEQMGTPLEIYKSPDTPFVAQFIGHTTVVENYDRLKGFDRIENADKAVIRPEFIKISKSGNLDRYQSAAEEGIVTDVVFRGNRMDITVSINGIEVVGERSLEKDLIAVGEKVHVLIYRLYIFDEEKTYLMENSEMQEQDVFYI